MTVKRVNYTRVCYCTHKLVYINRAYVYENERVTKIRVRPPPAGSTPLLVACVDVLVNKILPTHTLRTQWTIRTHTATCTYIHSRCENVCVCVCASAYAKKSRKPSVVEISRIIPPSPRLLYVYMMYYNNMQNRVHII